MKLTQLRLYTAGLLAFLLGIPLSANVLAAVPTLSTRLADEKQVGDIVISSLGLADAIVDASGGS